MKSIRYASFHLYVLVFRILKARRCGKLYWAGGSLRMTLLSDNPTSLPAAKNGAIRAEDERGK